MSSTDCFIKLDGGRIGRVIWGASPDGASLVTAHVIDYTDNSGIYHWGTRFTLADLANSFDEAFPSTHEVLRWLQDLQLMEVTVATKNDVFQLEVLVRGVGIMRIPPGERSFTQLRGSEASEVSQSIVMQLYDVAYPALHATQKEWSAGGHDKGSRPNEGMAADTTDDTHMKRSSPDLQIEGGRSTAEIGEGVRIKGRGRGRPSARRHL